MREINKIYLFYTLLLYFIVFYFTVKILLIFGENVFIILIINS